MSNMGWLIPTFITVMRGMSPLLIVPLALHGQAHYAFVLAALMAWTDKLDGDLARGWKWESKIGAYADIGADKLFCISLIYLAIELRGWDMWFILAGIVLVAYHVLTLSLRIFGDLFRTSNIAKLKMCVEMTALVLCLAPFAHEYLAWVEPFALAMLGFAAVFAFWSALTYLSVLPDIPDPRPRLRNGYARLLYMVGLRSSIPAE